MHAFFQAIIENKIEFEILIEDKTYLKINKENIEKSFEYIKKEAEKINLKNELFDKFLRVSGYLKCSRGNSKYLIDRDSYIEGLGRINIKVYTNPDDSSLKNHYCIMRLPLMTIEEFKFKQMGTPYQAICKIIDEKGNIVFMNLENATHKKLSSNYVRKKGKEKQYGDLLKQVHKKVKDAIKSIDGTVSKFRSISGLEKYLSKWQKTTDCSGQSLFRVIEARAPQSTFYQDQVGYMSISSCSIIDGKSTDDLAENDKVWNKYNDENGFTGGVYRWWPALGTPTDLDFDFYLAIGFESVEQLGRARDI